MCGVSKKKKPQTGKCPQKVGDKGGPHSQGPSCQTVREHGFALAEHDLPGGCKMCSGLQESAHCFMPLCGFQVQTLLKKCEHQMCCLNVFKTWLVKA